MTWIPIKVSDLQQNKTTTATTTSTTETTVSTPTIGKSMQGRKLTANDSLLISIVTCEKNFPNTKSIGMSRSNTVPILEAIKPHKTFISALNEHTKEISTDETTTPQSNTDDSTTTAFTGFWISPNQKWNPNTDSDDYDDTMADEPYASTECECPDFDNNNNNYENKMSTFRDSQLFKLLFNII